MKQFFKMMLASMAGMFVMFVLGSIILFFIVVGVVSGIGKKDKVDVKPNSILKMDLSYAIPERTIDNPLEGFSILSPETHHYLGLNDILKNIKKAETDDNIKGIYIDAGSCPNGMATLEAIRNQLEEFKKSGKFIISYGEMVSQKAYYLSSVGSAVYVNPSGMLIVKGFAAKLYFIKHMLDRLGITVQVYYDGKFKSATEPLRLDKMSDANRQQVHEYVFGIYHHFIDQIAASRNIDTKTLDSIADNALSMNTYILPKLKLADGLRFWDQVEDELKSKTGIAADEKLHFITMGQYTDVKSKEKINFGADKIAVVYAEGDIVDGEGGDRSIGSAKYQKIFSTIRDDKKVKAVVLRINSPGGSALASDVIWREVELTKKKMPVIVSMGDLAASGGYYIACDADSIVAEPNTITGSIGVFFILPNLQKFYNDQLGVTFDTVKTGKYSDLITTSRPLTEGEGKLFQQFVDTTYLDFKKVVSNGRHLKLDYVDSIAQGHVYTGTQALKLGLVDAMGNMEDAINIAKKKANLTDYRLDEYPKEEPFLDKLLKNMKESESVSIYEMMKDQLPTELINNLELLTKVKQMQGLQMKMPYEMELD